MRSVIALSALVALAMAAPAPVPQDDGIDFDGVSAFESAVATLPVGAPPSGTLTASVPTYTSTIADTSAAASATSDPVAENPDKRSIVGRDTACQAYPAGSAPPTTPDTPEAFQSNSNYSTIAQNAPTPQGYALAFSNLGGAVQSPSYLGYYILKSYDTIKCQEFCDQANGCSSFNVYIERDPSIDPADACTNPSSTANYKCALFGAPVCDQEATNVGQYREEFHVVIAASNAYVKTAPPPPQTNFTGPTELGGAIQVPSSKNSYLGMRIFSIYDPSQCAAVCQATTNFDKKHLVSSSGTYAPCNFFNTYILSKNNIPVGMYCSMYTQHWDKSYSTNVGQWDSAGNHYTVSSSYSYDLTTPDSGVIPASS